MPTYEYVCQNCGHELQELQSMNEPPLKHCPQCKTDRLTRVMGTGTSLIFKGSGFYLTDYKKEEKKSPGREHKKDEKKSENTEAKKPPPESSEKTGKKE
jgi:putative FmdB family regulatory protein